MAKKVISLKEELKNIKEIAEQIRKEDSVKVCYDFYQEKIPILNSIIERLRENKNETVIEKIAKSIENLVIEYEKIIPQKEIESEQKGEFNYEIYKELKKQGKTHNEIKEIARQGYGFDDVKRLTGFFGAYNKYEEPITEVKKELTLKEKPDKDRENIVEKTTKITRKAIYKINPKIREFYKEKGIVIKGSKTRLFINTFIDLQKRGENSKFNDFYLTLCKKDSDKYPLEEKWNENKMRVSSRLYDMKQRELVIQDENKNWKLNHYAELVKHLSPVPDEQIKGIYNNGEWQNISDAIDAGASIKDIREIYVLAGREKEFRKASNRYTREDNKYKKLIKENDGKPIEVTRDNGKRLEIGIDERGNVYHKDLSKYVEDMRNQGKL